MVAFNPFKACVFLASIHSAFAVDYSSPGENVKLISARDWRNNPRGVANVIESNHLQGFCSTWLGNNIPATTVTKTSTEVCTKQAIQTVNKVSTVVKGTTTRTTGTTVTKAQGAKTVATSYVTKVVTNYSTSVKATTVTTPVATSTVSTVVETATVTTFGEVITSVTISTIVDLTTITSTITTTPIFTRTPAAAPTKKRRMTGPSKRDRRRRVPDCLQYADDGLISAGCSLAIPPKTVTKTKTITTTTTKGTQTRTAYTSTTTIPANTRTVTSTSTVTVQSAITALSTITSTTTNIISQDSTKIISSTATETVSVTSTTTVPLISTFTSTSTTTSTSTSTSTATFTACPAATRIPGAFGIGVNSPGQLDFHNVATAEECCIACYDPNRTLNCVGWVSSGTAFCAVISTAPGPNPSETCPAGLGSGFILVDPNDMVSVGGTGPCTAPGGLVIS